MDNLTDLYSKAVVLKEAKELTLNTKQQLVRDEVLASFDKERWEQIAFCAEQKLIPAPKGFWTWKCPYCGTKLTKFVRWLVDSPPSLKLLDYNYFQCNKCNYEWAVIKEFDYEYYEGWVPMNLPSEGD